MPRQELGKHMYAILTSGVWEIHSTHNAAYVLGRCATEMGSDMGPCVFFAYNGFSGAADCLQEIVKFLERLNAERKKPKEAEDE